MIESIDNANTAQLRQWWQKLPADVPETEDMEKEDRERFLYDEVGSKLLENDPEGLSFLTGFAESKNVSQRASSLFFIANNCADKAATESLLVKAFHSNDLYLRGTALQGFIQTKIFPLKRNELETISDDWLAAWAMSYTSAAYPRNRITTLCSALKSKNPYMRAFACDIIGDQFIEHLKPKLKPLLRDKNPMVADAAGYNYYELLE